MDKKKKFFIGLGILAVIYTGVLSLNLTHDEETDGKKNSISEYSQENVIRKIKTDYSDLTNTIKPWFSFLLPQLELFRNTISAEYCTIKKEGEYYILLTRKHPQCVLFVKKSKDSARLASLKYEVISNHASRALNLNMKVNRAKILNTAAVRSKLTLSKNRLKKFPDKLNHSNNKVKEKVLMVFLAGIDQSYYQFNNPDKKKFQLKYFPPKPNEKQVGFEVVDNKFELIAPEKGGVLVLKCSDCGNNSIKIKATD